MLLTIRLYILKYEEIMRMMEDYINHLNCVALFVLGTHISCLDQKRPIVNKVHKNS